jgi:hypothetical protein
MSAEANRPKARGLLRIENMISPFFFVPSGWTDRRKTGVARSVKSATIRQEV